MDAWDILTDCSIVSMMYIARLADRECTPAQIEEHLKPTLLENHARIEVEWEAARRADLSKDQVADLLSLQAMRLGAEALERMKLQLKEETDG